MYGRKIKELLLTVKTRLPVNTFNFWQTVRHTILSNQTCQWTQKQNYYCITVARSWAMFQVVSKRKFVMKWPSQEPPYKSHIYLYWLYCTNVESIYCKRMDAGNGCYRQASYFLSNTTNMLDRSTVAKFTPHLNLIRLWKHFVYIHWHGNGTPAHLRELGT